MKITVDFTELRALEKKVLGTENWYKYHMDFWFRNDKYKWVFSGRYQSCLRFWKAQGPTEIEVKKVKENIYIMVGTDERFLLTDAVDSILKVREKTGY